MLFGQPASVDVVTHPPQPNVVAPIRCAWCPWRRLDGGGGGAGGVRCRVGRRARVRGGGQELRGRRAAGSGGNVERRREALAERLERGAGEGREGKRR